SGSNYARASTCLPRHRGENRDRDRDHSAPLCLCLKSLSLLFLSEEIWQQAFKQGWVVGQPVHSLKSAQELGPVRIGAVDLGENRTSVIEPSRKSQENAVPE